MGKVSSQVDEQISLLEERFISLTNKVKSLENDKTGMQKEIEALKLEISRLKENIVELQEKSKCEENRREAAEAVLRAAKTNHNIRLNDNTLLEYLAFDD